MHVEKYAVKSDHEQVSCGIKTHENNAALTQRSKVEYSNQVDTKRRKTTGSKGRKVSFPAKPKRNIKIMKV